MIYTEFHAQVHRDRDGRKRILFVFFILQKHVLVLLWVHTNKRLYRLLLVSVWAEMKEYFTSKWVHRRLHLSCSELLFSFHTPHIQYSSHFSRLILDWVLCKVASCYVSDAWMCDHSFSSGGFCSSAEALVDGDHRGWDSGCLSVADCHYLLQGHQKVCSTVTELVLNMSNLCLTCIIVLITTSLIAYWIAYI